MNNKYPFLHFDDGDLVEPEFNHYGGWPSKR
jgi:hypothetical protein